MYSNQIPSHFELKWLVKPWFAIKCEKASYFTKSWYGRY